MRRAAEASRALVRRGLERSRWGQRQLARRRRGKAIAFYRNFLSEDSLCFDVGANVGARTELFRAIGARTVAVEPQGACARELQERFGADSEVVVAAVAVGSHPGTAEIAICDEDSTISTIAPHWQTEGRFADREWNRTESVPVTTLDLLVEEHGTPAFCKIDIEGLERQALEGLSKPIPCISFEFTKEFLDEARACVALLARIGPLSVNASIGESMRFTGAWRDPDRLFQEIEDLDDDLAWGDVYVRFR